VKRWTIGRAYIEVSVFHPARDWHGRPGVGLYSISELHVPRSRRGHGVGGRLVDTVCAWADQEGFDLWLYIAPFDDSPMDVQGLLEMYSRRGFRWIPEVEVNTEMVRRAL
jgi:GNAT superfamily N-acetyltransferase